MPSDPPSDKDKADAAIDRGQNADLSGPVGSCPLSSQPQLPALARSPVEKLADGVRNMPNKGPTIEDARPGTVARMVTKSGAEVAGRSKFADKDLHPTLQGALDEVPESERAPPTQHGRCAEINTIDKALKQGEDVNGALIQTAKVKRPGNAQHGQPDEPCDSCRPVLKKLGIT